jgi:hypothetical protein
VISSRESLSYLRLDRVSIVPVVPNRLGFAILVRHLLADLGREPEGPLDNRDVLAVALPESMSKPLRAAIKDLPRVSLLVSRGRPEEAREVFGVTPCDGMVEAVRCAIERSLPLRFVDREVASGNILERDCSPDPAWADDWYALERGAAAYLNLIAESLMRAPRRLEPVDTWREVYMALALRRLSAYFRRVVFICQAPHVLPIRALLKRGEHGRGLEEEPGPDVEFEVQRPSNQILLRYLDDIPRLVERYERIRGEEKVALDFDKRTALLEELRDFSGSVQDERPSPRQLRVFCKLLPTQLRLAGRLTPGLTDCEALSDCCLDRRFSSAFLKHLMGYFSEVDLNRFAVVDFSARQGAAPEKENTSRPREYVARGCNPLQQNFTLLPAVHSKIENPYVWPRWSEHHNALRRKVYTVASSLQPIELTREYRGSIKRGINLRRTLASCYRGERRLFVRERLRRYGGTPNDRQEPIVWVFAEPGMQAAVRKRRIWFREDESNLYRAFFLVYAETKNIYTEASEEGGRIVEIHQAVGGLSFYDTSVALRAAKEALGDGWERRLPGEQPDDFCSDTETWLIDLLDLALQFAKERIYCVARTRLISVPWNGAAARGVKEIVTVAAEKVGLEAFRKLSSYCVVEGGRPMKGSDEVSRELIERYADIIDRKWP